MSEKSKIKLSLIMKDLSPELATVGMIKIGKKGLMQKSQKGNDFQPPIKLDYFLITTTERGEDTNLIEDTELSAQFPHTPEKPRRRIPIMLMFDEITNNFQCFHGIWDNTKKEYVCKGDGENAIRNGEVVPCPCAKSEWDYKLPYGESPCKWNAQLKFIIRGAKRTGGQWVLHTGSKNSTNGLLSSLMLFHNLTAGHLTGVSLDLVLTKKETMTPQKKKTTVWITSLEYTSSPEHLAMIGQKLREVGGNYGNVLQLKAAEVDHLFVDDMTDEEKQAYADEFYPEEAETAGGVIIEKHVQQKTETAAPVDTPSKRGRKQKETPAPTPETKLPPLHGPDKNGNFHDAEGNPYNSNGNPIPKTDSDGYYDGREEEPPETDDTQGQESAEVDDDPDHIADSDDSSQNSFAGAWGLTP